MTKPHKGLLDLTETEFTERVDKMLRLSAEDAKELARVDYLTDIYRSPIGDLAVLYDPTHTGIIALEWVDDADVVFPYSKTCRILQAYFEDGLPVTDYKPSRLQQQLNRKRMGTSAKVVFSFVEPTDLQRAVWQAIQRIPFGETRTYGQIAEQVGSHPRAVGSAVGANPIPILIPCHRVVGTNGKLTGYSGEGGLKTKQWLLDHEAKWFPISTPKGF